MHFEWRLHAGGFGDFLAAGPAHVGLGAGAVLDPEQEHHDVRLRSPAQDVQDVHPGPALALGVGIEQPAPMRVIADAMADQQVLHGSLAAMATAYSMPTPPPENPRCG